MTNNDSGPFMNYIGNNGDDNDMMYIITMDNHH